MPSQMFRDQNAGALLKALLGELDDIGIATWNVEGKITFLSQSCKRLMQLRGGARVGASIATLWRSPCAEFEEDLRRFRDGRRAGSCARELRLSRDGEDYWLRLQVRSLSQGHGRETVYLLLVRDVTAKWTQAHSAEKIGDPAVALSPPPKKDLEWAGGLPDPLENLRRYERMVSSSRDALVLLGRDHRYLAVNQAYLDLWRKERGEVVGHHISLVVGERFYKQISLPAFERCLKGEAFSFTCQYVDYPSGGRYIEATHTPYRDDQGVICGILMTLRDVTQRHLAELALQESEAKFRAIFDYAPVGMGILDEQDGRLLDINLDGAALLGYSREEILQLRPWDVTEGLTPKDFFASWTRIRKRGRVRFESTHVIKKDGSRLHVLINAISTSLQGRCVLIMTVVDITRQKLLESRLREHEHQYRSLVESTSAILFTADPGSFRFTFVSPEAEKLLGYPLRQWLEEPGFWASHMHPEDRVWAPKYCIGATRKKRDHCCDYRMLAADGGEVWLHNCVSLVMEGGQVESLVGVMVDISEQKRAEAERWRLSEIVEQSADAILLTDTDFHITYINEAFHELYGYTLRELRGARPEVFNAEADAREISTQIYAALRAGERVFRELVNRRKDGSLFTCQHTISPLRDVGGGIIAYMSSQRDVSQRVQAERALRQSEEKYRQIVETAQEGIWVLDAQDCTTFVNSSMARMLGYTETGMLGKPLFDFMDGSVRGEAENRLREYRHGRSSVFEFRLRDQEGHDVWTSVSANPLFDERGYVGVIAMIDDISEARSLREALIRSQKMEAVGQLTGGIAHDFNNILGSILGFTELAQERFGGGHDKLREYLRQIEIAGGRARDLIRKLLIFSRGENINAAKPVSLAGVVQEVLGMLEPMLPAMVEIRTEMPREPLFVTIDPLHVQQLLMNLCINARDAIDGAGVITVTLSLRQSESELCSICGEPIQGEWVSLRVSDTGHGILEELKGDIFQPFITSKEVGEGSGMGLAVVRGIVRSYGGHLRVESVASRGASFEILLQPCGAAEPREEGGKASRGDSIDLMGRSILLVDDEPQIRVYFETVFTGLGAEVVCCSNGAQALGRFAMASGAFDLVVSDQTMPGMSGRELAQQLHLLGSEVPVILCSGYSEIMEPEEARLLNIVAQLQKPVSKAALLAMVETALQGP